MFSYHDRVLFEEGARLEAVTGKDRVIGSEKGQGEGARSESIREVESVRAHISGNGPHEVRDRVVVEEPLTIEIKGVASYTLMYTPTDAMALALGFAFSEGLISSLDDVNLFSRCSENPGLVRMELKNVTGGSESERHLAIVSSCGICGRPGRKESDGFPSPLPKVGSLLWVPLTSIFAAMKRMQSRQRVFYETGGTHAAEVFDAEGELISFSEDIARHNALDKAIGKCLLENRPLAGCGVALSGRVSFELVAKSARAGIELIAAVSAPSSLAIEAAERSNITLCGFVREGRATIYTHPQRIEGVERGIGAPDPGSPPPL